VGAAQTVPMVLTWILLLYTLAIAFSIAVDLVVWAQGLVEEKQDCRNR
jgi:hypothetical protein